MANGFTRVQPGDLISSGGYNDLLTAFEDLEARVTALEGGTIGGGGLAITGLVPLLGPYRIGDTLTVLGRNFGFSVGGTRLFLNSVRVLDLGAGSNDTQLVFTIPPVPGVAEPGVPVTLRVVTGSGEEVTRDIVLRPAQVTLFGDVDVTWLAVNPTTIVPDAPATFQFRINSRASAEADFLIDPIVSVGVNQGLWQSRVQVLDGALNPLSTRMIHLTPSQQATFHVRITSVPTGTNGVQFQLTAGASSGGVIGTSGALPFEVGQTAQPPDTTITLAPTAVIGTGSLTGDTLTLATSQTTRVRFLVTFQVAGTYDLTLTAPAVGSGWTAQRFPTTPASYVITAADIGAGGTAQRFPELSISTGATPNAAASVALQYQRQGNTSVRTRTLNLSL